ncbi:MAG: hypothetical protein ACKPKW_02430, partial [Dolichospermum sp.]
TFERIWNNLLAIRDSSLPFSILLRLHFNPDTFNFLDPLLEDINRARTKLACFTVSIVVI